MKKTASVSGSHDPNPGRSRLSTLALAALGVVYGDIGTSPLYAVKEVFNPNHGIPFSTANVLGGVSAIFWSLMIVVSVKYVVLIMRADNKGAGGIMALVALAIGSVRDHPKLGARLALVGVFGAALFYGDGVITPAISVLSAIEGLEVATPLFKPYIVPLTVAVVIGLFSFQRKGTSTVGALFGPVMIVWFLTLAAIGVINILKEPKIFSALNPIYAFRFLTDHGFASFVVLGSVFLAVTGAETLVRLCAAWTDIELLRPGSVADRQSSNCRKPVLFDVPRLGAVSDGRHCHDSDRHRVPGGHHRNVLDD